MDIDIPFTYNLPNSTAGLVYAGRKLEEDHAAIFEIAEDLLNKQVFLFESIIARFNSNSSRLSIILRFLCRFGLNGKACILKTICELAESKGLPFNGLLGKAFETLFL